MTPETTTVPWIASTASKQASIDIEQSNWTTTSTPSESFALKNPAQHTLNKTNPTTDMPFAVLHHGYEDDSVPHLQSHLTSSRLGDSLDRLIAQQTQ